MTTLDFKEIISGDDFELFARDFLAELGFTVLLGPGRGPDGGQDMLVAEELKGTFGHKTFKWLVSCKHNATSGKAVGTSDENNLLDRMKQHQADGFLGVYSTMPSAALLTRLKELSGRGEIGDFKILDGRFIDARVKQFGFSKLTASYFPESFRQLRPPHSIFSNYEPLECEICGKDWLVASYESPMGGLIGYAGRYNEANTFVVEDVYVACKGDHDRHMESRMIQRGLSVNWEDVGDLLIPSFYIRHVVTLLNSVHKNRDGFTDEALSKLKIAILKIGQRTLRDITGEESQRVADLHALYEAGL